MKEHSFRGKTGYLRMIDGKRTNAEYDIMRFKEGRNGRRELQKVGYAAGLKVKLQKQFWFEGNVQRQVKIKAVTIEDYPSVIRKKHRLQTGEECLLSHLCTYHANRSVDLPPVKYCCIGILIDLLIWIERDLGVEFDLYIVQDGMYGNYVQETKQWNGMIRDLMDGKADMALAALVTNTRREKVVNFSFPILYPTLKILVSSKPVDSLILGFEFLNAFEPSLWLAALLVINVILVIVWLLERLSPYGHRHKSYDYQTKEFNLSVCMSYIWSTVFKLQLDEVMPKSSSARLTAAVFSFWTLVLTTSYTAKLAASVVRYEAKVPVTGIRDPKVSQAFYIEIFKEASGQFRSHQTDFITIHTFKLVTRSKMILPLFDYCSLVWDRCGISGGNYMPRFQKPTPSLSLTMKAC